MTVVWDLDRLLAAELAGERLKFVFFWGHEPTSGGGIGPHVFSQWYPYPFTVGGTTYATAEHWMMAAKARCFADADAEAAILAAASPGEAKAIGRTVRGFDSDVWDRVRLDVVTQGNVAKFASDDVLRAYLVGTGDRVLVEASPVDRIWGIGLAADDPAATQPSRWTGRNLLGEALMRARAELAPG